MAPRASGSPPAIEITFRDEHPTTVTTDALVLTVPHDDDWPEECAAVNQSMNGRLRETLERLSFSGSVGSTQSIPTLGAVPARQLIITGLPTSGASAEDVRIAYGVATAAARKSGAETIALAIPGGGLSATEGCRAAIEGILLALYDFRTYQSAEDNASGVETIILLGEESPEASAGVREGLALAAGIYLARDMVFEPPNEIYPVSLAAVAREMSTNQELEFQEFDEQQLAEMGAGAITAVGQGSVNPPRLVRMTYTPAGESLATIALVGKGITFDTGGMSLKTGEGMVTMKTDMGGAAAVLGAMRAISELDLPFTVHGILAAAENMPSDTAYRPSDVLTALNGKTIEVISTDAEGRLVLADALVYAARLGAEEMIDLATLTGAKTIALGNRSVAVFCNDDQMAQDIVAAGDEAGELFWRMPLWEEQRSQLKSETADMKNTGGRPGGAITAALFIEEFTEGKKWAHLDIAGAAWASSTKGYTPKGASGVGVRALVNYLENKAAALNS